MTGGELASSLPAGWKRCLLGEICEAGGGGIQTGPFGSQLHASDYVPVGIPSIMPQNIGDNRIVADGIARISEEDAIRLSKYRVEPGDIVYSRRGDVERRALIRSSEDGWLCGTGCLRVRLGDGPADPAFVAFYLGTPEAREWIVRHAHGATMPNLNTSILAACPIVVPPLPEQRAIAGVLSALDDKIELNRRTGATLEAMARAIFRDWFVDFGPTRAKAEGREPYLAPDLWPLFPARLNDQGIPEGWEVSEIGKEITAVGGSTPSTKEPSYWGGGVNWATPKDLSPL
ncbi:type I restriction enzyme, S subunit, partial [Ruegeria intermedia]